MLVRSLAFLCCLLLPAWCLRAQGTNITVSGNSAVGLGSLTETANVTWNATGYNNIEVHVGSPTGGLLDAGAQSGGATTGNWVTNGMTFFLVNAYTGKWLASTTAHFDTAANGSNIQFYASTNPIPGATESSYGATTVYFSAPGYTNLQVHIGSPTGAVFTSGNYSGQATTGNWVGNGTSFYLVDANTGTTLSSLATYIAPQDTKDPNPTAGDGVPEINGPNGAVSAEMWYLGGAPSADGYSIQSQVYLSAPTPSSPTPHISWSTDSPSRVSITPSADGTSAILTATGASAYQAGFDIHITVTYNGVNSKPFPVFINTPYTMTTSPAQNYCQNGVCGCPLFGYSSDFGYISVVTHGVAGIDGTIMSPIRLNESLEHQQWLTGNWASQGGYPTPSNWTAGQWNAGTNTFSDYLWICSDNATVTPPVSSYNPNGTTMLLNETQKFWVGSASQFNGSCVEKGIVSLYTDHGTLTSYETPIVNKSDCNQGNTIN